MAMLSGLFDCSQKAKRNLQFTLYSDRIREKKR